MADTGGPVIAKERLYLTADRDRVVPDGDPQAAFLFCTPGAVVPRADALRYGLLDDNPAPKDDQADDGGGDDQGDDGAGAEEQAESKPRSGRTKPRPSGAAKSGG